MNNILSERDNGADAEHSTPPKARFTLKQHIVYSLRFLLTIIIVLALYFVGTFLGEYFIWHRSDQKKQAVRSLSYMQREMNRVSSAAIDSDGLPVQIDRSSSRQDKSSGEYGELERVFDNFLDRMVAQRNDYLREIHAIDLDSILDFSRISRDSLYANKVKVNDARAIVNKYENMAYDLFRDIGEQISSLNISRPSRNEFISGYENGISKSKIQLSKQWKLERQTLDQLENIVVLLAASYDWEVEDDQLIFSNEDDLIRFNTYLETIQNIEQQQEQIQKNGRDQVNQFIDSVK